MLVVTIILQSNAQVHTKVNKSLTELNAKQAMQGRQWCYHRFTSCTETGTLALNLTMLHTGANDHMLEKLQ